MSPSALYRTVHRPSGRMVICRNVPLEPARDSPASGVLFRMQPSVRAAAAEPAATASATPAAAATALRRAVASSAAPQSAGHGAAFAAEPAAAAIHLCAPASMHQMSTHCLDCGQNAR